ncbi:MAG: ComF family protein [Proteobacteria bacterium]|nr:ComF family protein [Pseudomonadota bacterium]MBU1708554.1 ComF family protein [Pseudomonadota bacterium]
MDIGIKTLYSGAMDLLFPPVCLACGNTIASPAPPGKLLCDSCNQDIDTVNNPLCSCCGQAFSHSASTGHTCGFCLTHKWYFTKARALVHYEEPIKAAIHSLKYRGKTAWLPFFTYLYKKIGLPDLSEPDIILPVPLHKNKLKERGFNQAQLLAKAFFPKQKNKILPDILIKIKDTEAQTGKTGMARRVNVTGCFGVNQKHAPLLTGKTVLLVDDVFTTGATVNECARTIQKHHPKDIQVLTLARVKTS